MRTLRVFVISFTMFMFVVAGFGQSPAPVLLQAATPAPIDAKEQSDISEMIRLLREVKARNAEMLKQQQVTLEALDQLQKEADQIRIFSKRG